LDFLSSPLKEILEIEFSGSLNPGVFKIPGDDDFLHLIMPVRLQNSSEVAG